MFDRAELKARAKAQLQGNVLMLFLIAIIPVLIYAFLNGIPVLGNIAALIVTPCLTFGALIPFLNLANGAPFNLDQIFALREYWWKAFCLSFRVGLRIFLWSLLLWVPGIIATYRYFFAFYIFAENPNLSNDEIMELSRVMTEGRKMDLFMLSLSFIGWGLLCAVTCGIAAVWVMPYMNATLAHAYLTVKTQYNR